MESVWLNGGATSFVGLVWVFFESRDFL